MAETHMENNIHAQWHVFMIRLVESRSLMDLESSEEGRGKGRMARDFWRILQPKGRDLEKKKFFFQRGKGQCSLEKVLKSKDHQSYPDDTEDLGK